VIELNRSRNNVVLSRRAVLEDERKEQRQQILDRLNPGDVVDGQISNIVDFGAFVDLDGMDGLIHISELSWSHVNHPSEVLEIGQDVKVKVLDIDRERQRISLGLKQTQSDPWQQVLDTYSEGDEVEGKVTKVVTFGAFVEILPGVEGLVHISELAQHHVENPREVVSQGDEVKAKIIEVDGERRRLSLSLKRVEGGGVVARADDAEPIEGTPDLDLSEEVFPETQAPLDEAEREPAEPEPEPVAAAVETPGGEASETAPPGTGDLEEELVDESIEADAQSPDEPGPGDSEGEAPRPPKPKGNSRMRPVAVAITGGIGAGKTEALHAFARHGAATISSDDIVHRLLLEDDDVRAALLERFGTGILDDAGTVDRAAISRIVFDDREALAWLEALLHRRVVAEYLAWREALAGLADPPAVSATEVPLLYEVGGEERFDAVVAITAPEDVRRERSGVSSPEQRETRLIADDEKAGAPTSATSTTAPGSSSTISWPRRCVLSRPDSPREATRGPARRARDCRGRGGVRPRDRAGMVGAAVVSAEVPVDRPRPRPELPPRSGVARGGDLPGEQVPTRT
jgi:dephospho-CoA kinase